MWMWMSYKGLKMEEKHLEALIEFALFWKKKEQKLQMCEVMELAAVTAHNLLIRETE